MPSISEEGGGGGIPHYIRSCSVIKRGAGKGEVSLSLRGAGQSKTLSVLSGLCGLVWDRTGRGFGAGCSHEFTVTAHKNSWLGKVNCTSGLPHVERFVLSIPHFVYCFIINIIIGLVLVFLFFVFLFFCFSVKLSLLQSPNFALCFLILLPIPLF